MLRLRLGLLLHHHVHLLDRLSVRLAKLSRISINFTIQPRKKKKYLGVRLYHLEALLDHL